jgi:hypothetical protein
MSVYIEESEIHDIDVLAQTISHLAARLSLHDPLREPIEVIAGIIIDKTQEWQRRYEASLHVNEDHSQLRAPVAGLGEQIKRRHR